MRHVRELLYSVLSQTLPKKQWNRALLQPHNFEFVLKNGAPPGQRDELNRAYLQPMKFKKTLRN
jgi:hypothetical protein